jgi:hypothetical protein
MERRIASTVLAVAGIVLWFMPLVTTVDFTILDFRMKATQAGNDLGGVAWLLLAAVAAAALLAWLEQHVPLALANAVASGVSLHLLVKSGRQAAWGLYGLLAVSGLGMALALGWAVRRRP